MNIHTGATPTKTIKPSNQDQKPDDPVKGQDGNPAPTEPIDGFSRGLTTVYDMAKNTGIFAFNEVTAAAKNDPALGMRLFATTVSDKLLEGVDDGVRGGFDKAIVPTIRAGLLGLNTLRLANTLKNPNANLANKGLDALRVATDLIGLAGGILKAVSPARAGLAEGMMGFAYAADTVSHAIRGLEHGAERVQVWKAEAAKKKDGQHGKQQPVAPDPITQPKSLQA